MSDGNKCHKKKKRKQRKGVKSPTMFGVAVLNRVTKQDPAGQVPIEQGPERLASEPAAVYGRER